MLRRTDADISNFLRPDGTVGELPWRFARELMTLGNAEVVLENTDAESQLVPRYDPINFYNIAQRFDYELPNLITAADVLTERRFVPTPANMHKLLKFRVTQESIAFMEEACVRGFMKWGMYGLRAPEEGESMAMVKVRQFMVGRTVLAYYPTEQGRKFAQHLR